MADGMKQISLLLLKSAKKQIIINVKTNYELQNCAINMLPKINVIPSLFIIWKKQLVTTKKPIIMNYQIIKS